ncbi:hypothetical protein DXG03_002102 [Asterophora parasitica]|uniref:Uncharacterized protein n=1 Tax=Asterophora parasitica TaxID=117018 RepID=A0A9P7G2D2_9AGAR|nr:hypothetical protein DXG03_002102 [Asterophora parasitica]
MAAISLRGVALVTGASKGIGRAIAFRLAKDGFDVGINDLPGSREGLDSLQREIKAAGRRVTILVGDVSKQENVEEMVNTVVRDLGQLNVVTEVDEWDQLFAVNARGVFLCYKYAATQMIKQERGGRIIGASSVAGRQGTEGLAAYCATKFAVRGITQVAAREWGRHGITVNAYCPGIIETDMLKDLFSGPLSGMNDALKDACALGHHGTTADVASLVSYLASKEAHFITGQSIGVDGGRHLS